jgi:molybdopterin-containing oxidoreductase family iron-sulfur binding subunit
MLVRNRENHVVKCEGNPVHPINQGRLCARGQAALHGLYDPDRIKGPMRRGVGGFDRVGWKDALDAVGSMLRRRSRIAFISTLETGSFDALVRAWLGALGSSRYLIYEPINYESVKSAVGGVVPTFNIAGSDYLISFAADFLETWISPVEYAVEFAAMREIRNNSRARFVYVGPRVSMTAANADERIIVPPGSEAAVALAIASELGAAEIPSGFTANEVGERLKIDPGRIRRISRELRNASAPLVLPGGDTQTARTVMFLNSISGSSLVNPGRPHAVTNIASRADMRAFIADMDRGMIDVLMIYGSNPVYSLPAADHFLDALKRVPNVISISSYMDETSTHADWILPSNTPLESWGDYVPYADVVNLMQPTMGAVFDTSPHGDTLIALAERSGVDTATTFRANNYYEYVRLRNGASSPVWEGGVQIGGRWSGAPAPAILSIPSVDDQPAPINGLAASPSGPIFSPNGAPASPPTSATAVSAVIGTVEVGDVTITQVKDKYFIHTYPNIYLYDGRGANRWWLQEMSEPVIKGVWGTWAEMHPDTARKLGVRGDDVIEISNGSAAISVPVYLWPGTAPDTISVPIGEGHTDYGRFANGVGANVLRLLSTEVPIASVKKTGESQEVLRRRGSTGQYGRNIALTTVLGQSIHREHVSLPLPEGVKYTDFYGAHTHQDHRWAMVVDMDRCIGCNACVAACYAENNIAVVGPDGIRRKRGMEWLRIDPYIDWKRSSDPILFQPMLCQHCDNAPCESVCPVFAAAHNEEGVNMQVYNRCVGTRYCSNNCPYKVRRFNWFDYKWPEPLNWQLNPDVTVRCRGVMEKCTFCWQRIREAEIVAKREGRTLRDGEVIPACVETCPTGVYTFGDLKDPKTEVSRIIRYDPRAYQVLQEPLNTRPAVIYLKRVVEKS